jgi:hypothetical protein
MTLKMRNLVGALGLVAVSAGVYFLSRRRSRERVLGRARSAYRKLRRSRQVRHEPPL